MHFEFADGSNRTFLLLAQLSVFSFYYTGMGYFNRPLTLSPWKLGYYPDCMHLDFGVACDHPSDHSYQYLYQYWVTFDSIDTTHVLVLLFDSNVLELLVYLFSSYALVHLSCLFNLVKS
jgi:hypothetical protein